MNPQQISEIDRHIAELQREGCTLLRNVLTVAEVAGICHGVDRAMKQSLAAAAESSPEAVAVRSRSESIYAARNLLDLWPAATEIWRVQPLIDLLTCVLGPDFGLVRGLFFDKPPEQTWALPWHKDLMIAIHPNSRPGPRYSPPRPRAGVMQCEPPLEVLERMLTVRFHLDPMTPDNGPLEVLPGSHRTGKTLRIEENADFAPCKILGDAGDLFVMRPLLAHASGTSTPGNSQHRRIVHLEFCGLKNLPDGVHWHWFFP